MRLPSALVLAACLSTGWAYADETAPVAIADAGEIQLKNGESMRGTIVAVEPGQRVIVIVAGEQSVIPWSEVARIVGGPKESSPSATPEIPTPAAPASAPTKGMPVIHIESDWPEAELSRIDGGIGVAAHSADSHIGGHTLSRYVCRAPCDKPVDGRDGHRFFIAAHGMYPSEQFRLEAFDGHVTARVHGVSFARYAGGIATVAAGGMFTLGGGMFFGMSFLAAGETPSAENPDPKRAAEQVRTVGLAIGAVGIVGIVTGLVMLSGGRTRVELIETKRGNAGLVFDGGVLRF